MWLLGAAFRLTRPTSLINGRTWGGSYDDRFTVGRAEIPLRFYFVSTRLSSLWGTFSQNLLLSMISEQQRVWSVYNIGSWKIPPRTYSVGLSYSAAGIFSGVRKLTFSQKRISFIMPTYICNTHLPIHPHWRN